MSVLLVAFGCRFFVTNPRAVVLSVCTGVGGCLCPISLTVFLAGMAWRELMKRAPILASAAEVMTFFYDLGNVEYCPVVWWIIRMV